MLNSDVRVLTENWLEGLIDRFRKSDAAIVGLIETASRLREDGCGIPIKARGAIRFCRRLGSRDSLRPSASLWSLFSFVRLFLF